VKAWLYILRAQKDWTRGLARRLRDAGFHVWFDEWCLRGGGNWIVGLRRGVNESRHPHTQIVLGNFAGSGI